MSVVKGYAYTKQEAETVARYKKRIAEIGHLRDCLVDKVDHDYGRNRYFGNLRGHNLSDEDIVIICDGGLAPFGGKVDRFEDGMFICDIPID